MEQIEGQEEYRSKRVKKKPKKSKLERLKKKLQRDEKYVKMFEGRDSGFIKGFKEELERSVEKTKRKIKELECIKDDKF